MNKSQQARPQDMDDYTHLMIKKMRSLRHFERCLFSVWCCDYLLESHAELLKTEISESQLSTLQNVLNQIWEKLLEGSIPETDHLHELDAQFMRVDIGGFEEFDPYILNLVSAIGICILCCRRNDTQLAQMLGERVIEVLLDDYSIEEEHFFDNPVLKEELDTQLTMIRHLAGKYELDEGLRRKFRYHLGTK